MTTFNSTVVIMTTGMTVLLVLIWGVISLSLLWSSDQKHEIVDRFTWVGFWASTVPFPKFPNMKHTSIHKQTIQPRTHTVHTDRTSGTRRLNSSKHPHEPLAARPLKMLPRRGRVPIQRQSSQTVFQHVSTIAIDSSRAFSASFAGATPINQSGELHSGSWCVVRSTFQYNIQQLQ